MFGQQKSRMNHSGYLKSTIRQLESPLYFATVLKPKFYFLLISRNTFIGSINSFKHAKHLKIWEFLIHYKALNVHVFPSTWIFAFFTTAYPELEGIRAKLGR